MFAGRPASPEADSAGLLDPSVLRAALHALPETAALVLAPDAPAFTILEVTDQYLAATLKRREDLVGRPLFEAMPDLNPANPFPSGVDKLRASLERVLATRTAHRMALQRYDIDRRDGGWEERYWAPQNVPLPATGEPVRAILHHVRDVTAEVLGRQAVARAEELAASTLERMADGYLLLDRGFHFVAVNAAAERLLGRSRRELLGRTHWEVFPTSAELPTGRAYRRVVAEGIEQHLTQHYVGEGLDAHLEVDAYPTDEGGVAIFWRDITQRVLAEAELREASWRKDLFIATLAHELRNPLAPIVNGAQILRRAGTDSPAGMKALDVMERQLGHIVQLLNDLLDISRISQGKVTLRRERIELRRVLDDALEAARPFAEARQHRVETDLRLDGVELEADAVRLLQVTTNLLHNAAKYTEPGGTIRLSAWADAQWAVIEVADTGIGIPHEKLASIFETFTQLGAPAGDQAQAGLGIGLSISRHLVELHGGSLAAASPGPGQGATFTVRLPRMP